ncbi:ribonuclease 3-like protein 2-like [Tripterygium wilfordii]|uniref:Ribonuclease 3-like protein 2-like n=1 Tax=Tripterygium wilfordii TaxID=458696 RepID=A0A7J7C8Q2_TRIWF|nr:ribonuclease 3-like protein 2 [Tripterygium wilfordii]KAF5730531.1 ribonuclease 3-like protein 2-like [Tripterygium wilfordii]
MEFETSTMNYIQSARIYDPSRWKHDPYAVPPPYTVFSTTTAMEIGQVPRIVPASPEMELAVSSVERIIKYRFNNKRLLEEALTHSSYSYSASYQRLEFVGDAALGNAFSNFVFLAYPELDQGQLTLLRAANVSTEKLARVAVRLGLYQYVRRNAASLDDKVREFTDAVSNENGAVAHGGSVKAPKVLADIVESVAAASYVDVNFDLQKLWVIFRGLLEPIVTPDDLQQQPQPVTMLFELCQKQGKKVDLKYWRNGPKIIVSVYVDGCFIFSGSSEHKEIAKLNAAKGALHKLLQPMDIDNQMSDMDTDIQMRDICDGNGINNVFELCGKEMWLIPSYNFTIENNEPYTLPPLSTAISTTAILHEIVPRTVPASPDMELTISAVERIINYNFRNKRFLEEALTHSSYTNSASYERLEFIGDAALGLAFSNYVYLAYTDLDPGQLSLLRAANISTEKLARVAVRHELYRHLRHNASSLDDKMNEFAAAVSNEDSTVVHGGSMRAPKILADCVESVAAAIYADVNFDLQKLWVIYRGFLEPIVTPKDLQPQPVTLLFELCQKQGKQVHIEHWRNGAKNIASIYVDGHFITSGSSEQKEIAKLNAVKGALHKLLQSMSTDSQIYNFCDEIDDAVEMEGAKQKLHELCGKKKWPKPYYSIENEDGPAHDKKFVCSVKIATVNGILYMSGDQKARVKEAENSAASFMIRALRESSYLRL